MDDERRTVTTSKLVISLGSINADFQFRVQHRPEVSETLVATDFRRFGGGKAANVAYFVRSLGCGAVLMGRTGDDDLAGQALRPLTDIGVDISGVRKVAEAATGVALVMVPPDGKEGIVFAPNANMEWTDADAAEVTQSLIDAPSGTVLVVDCGIPSRVLEQATIAARCSHHVFILDPSPAENATAALIASATVIVPNSLEAEQLTSIKCNDASSAEEAGALLLARGAAAACVKFSEGGCVLVEKRQVTHIGSVPVDVVDTTGAGDAFAAALAAALAEHHSLVDAARLAAAASHLAVTTYGAQTAPLT